MASIERRQRGGRSTPVRWRARWRDEAGRSRSKTFKREDEARRFRVRLDGELAAATWVDPACPPCGPPGWTGCASTTYATPTSRC